MGLEETRSLKRAPMPDMQRNMTAKKSSEMKWVGKMKGRENAQGFKTGKETERSLTL